MNNTKLFLGNIPTWAEKTGIERIFSAYGDILELEIAINRITEEPLGYAYITFFSPDAARRALEKDGYPIGGQVVQVKYAEDE